MLITKRQEDETICFTYKVEMVVQVFAENVEQANVRLDENGGYVSSRVVNLLDTNVVYTGPNDEDSTKEPSETV